MTEVAAYALACGFGLSALLVPLTALGLRRAADLRSDTRHTIWFMVLVATVAATVAAYAVSALRPAPELADAVVSMEAPPAGVFPAGVTAGALCAFALAGWLVVASARVFRIARRVLALRAMKRRATPLDLACELPRGARALVSDAGVAAAVGFLHPAILLPAGIMETLEPKDARRIVLHEAAHLRRRDDLTGLAFLLCAAMFWFNPFVHYIGKKLSLECELACDEAVVEQTGDAARYATLLYEMAETMFEGPQLAWNGFVRRSGLVTRVQHLLAGRDAARRALPCPALAVLIGVLTSAVGLAVFNAPALARAERPTVVDGNWPKWTQPVRAFPPCKVRKSSGTRKVTVKPGDGTACEYPAMHDVTSWSTRIKKKGATP